VWKYGHKRQKFWPFKGKNLGCTDKKIVERVDKFTYFGYTLSYKGEINISNKLTKYECVSKFLD
jgi:hypothetical protein